MMAHQIVWATAATITPDNRPRCGFCIRYGSGTGNRCAAGSPTGPTPLKQADLKHSPVVSLNDWAPTHDTCRADCKATWHFEDQTRERIWNVFKNAAGAGAMTRR